MTQQKSGSTTGAGAPAVSDRNSLTVGPNGPVVLHDVPPGQVVGGNPAKFIRQRKIAPAG